MWAEACRTLVVSSVSPSGSILESRIWRTAVSVASVPLICKRRRCYGDIDPHHNMGRQSPLNTIPFLFKVAHPLYFALPCADVRGRRRKGRCRARVVAQSMRASAPGLDREADDLVGNRARPRRPDPVPPPEQDCRAEGGDQPLTRMSTGHRDTAAAADPG